MMVIQVLGVSLLAVWIAITFCTETYDPETGNKRSILLSYQVPLSNRLLRFLVVLASWLMTIFWK